MEEVERPLHWEAGGVQGVLVGREVSTHSAEEESMLRERFCWFNDAQYFWMVLFPRLCNRLKGKGSQWKSNADDMSAGGRFTMKPWHVSFRAPYLQGSFWGLGRGLVILFVILHLCTKFGAHITGIHPGLSQGLRRGRTNEESRSWSFLSITGTPSLHIVQL